MADKASLLIFDRDGGSDAGVFPGAADLFPLTGDWRLTRRVRDRRAGAVREVLDSARLVEEEVDRVRETVGGWSAELGNLRAGGKTLKEWFLTPDRGVSAWWFSLLSEKNPLKTDVFLKLAQLRVLEKLFQSGRYGSCAGAVGDPVFRAAVSRLARRAGVGYRLRAARHPGFSWRGALRGGLERAGLIGDLVHALLKLAEWVWLAALARGLGPKGAGAEGGEDLLVVTYFPAVDREAAEQGRFQDLYFGPLQELWQKEGRRAHWILLYVPFDRRAFVDALALAKRFSVNGWSVTFLHRFLSAGILARTLLTWGIQVLNYLRVRSALDRAFAEPALAPPEGRELLARLGRRSFAGWVGLSGLLYFELFKEVFRRFPKASRCLYVAEMHAWEKALNGAKRSRRPGVVTVGFQHAAVSRNEFHYFHAPEEARSAGGPLDAPLPDRLACNGEVPRSLLARQGYAGVRSVEALRHLGLARALKGDDSTKRRPPVVVAAGSIDRRETLALLSLVTEALPRPAGFQVWLKGHPSMPVQPLLAELGIPWPAAGFEVRDEPVDRLLAEARAAVVGGSSVALDALALGCRVIVPVFPDGISVNPLGGFEDAYRKVSTPAALKEAVEEALARPPAPEEIRRGRELAASYWNLDESLPLWRELMGLAPAGTR